MPMKVFLVDDSAQVVERLMAMLTAVPGIEVIGSAADLPEAIHLVRTARPDIVILDLNLPSGSGIRLLQAIKTGKLEVKAIVLTNYAFPQYRNKCLEAGAYAFLDKSTDFAIVPQVLIALSQPHEHPPDSPSTKNSASRSEPRVKISSR
jgi:DNA-binding NarL/FixJ family response regulator